MEYVVKNRTYGVYVREVTKGSRHLVPSIVEATRYSRKNATIVLNGFNHPENWEIKVVNDCEKIRKR